MNSILINPLDVPRLIDLAKRLGTKDATHLITLAIDALESKVRLATQELANAAFVAGAEKCMLHPYRFTWANVLLGPPAGHEDEVYSVFAGRIEWGGMPAIVTAWQLTDEQVETINRERLVWIANLGHTIMPTCVMSESPVKFQWVRVLI